MVCFMLILNIRFVFKNTSYLNFFFIESISSSKVMQVIKAVCIFLDIIIQVLLSGWSIVIRTTAYGSGNGSYLTSCGNNYGMVS